MTFTEKEVAVRQNMIIAGMATIDAKLDVLIEALGITAESQPDGFKKIEEAEQLVKDTVAELKKVYEDEENAEKQIEGMLERFSKSPIQAFSDLAPTAQEGGPQV